jgi:hypothetical protein
MDHLSVRMFVRLQSTTSAVVVERPTVLRAPAHPASPRLIYLTTGWRVKDAAASGQQR